MGAIRERQLPTAELLLDVRTPAELAVSPDGTAIAFALHATVADQGSFVASSIAETGSEVELVVYPREGHVPLERAHALDAIARTQAWFDTHL